MVILSISSHVSNVLLFYERDVMQCGDHIFTWVLLFTAPSVAATASTIFCCLILHSFLISLFKSWYFIINRFTLIFIHSGIPQWNNIHNNMNALLLSFSTATSGLLALITIAHTVWSLVIYCFTLLATQPTKSGDSSDLLILNLT